MLKGQLTTMRQNLIIPKALKEIKPDESIFFLAGPIMGGGDWQEKAFSLLEKLSPKSYIACPCRYEPDHKLHCFCIAESNSKIFPSQTLWERHYLELASKQGCIIFWLPEENKLNPRPLEMGPYARDSYGELGEWRARIFYNKAKVVIGAEEGFPGLSVLTKNFKAMLGDNFIIHKTLEETIKAAVDYS